MATVDKVPTEREAPETMERSAPRLNVGFLYAGIWIVFLAVPVISIVNGDAGPGLRTLGFVSVVLFGVVYLWLAWWYFTESGDYSPPTNRNLVLGVVLLAAIGSLAIPSAGPWVSSFTPYIAALVIYSRRLGVGIPLGLLIWAVPSVAAFLLSETNLFWIIGGPGVAMMFITVMSITEHHEERDRRRAEELREAEARDAIARDVHDVLGHSLTVLTVKAQLARRLMEVDPQRSRAELEEMERLSREALSQVRSTVTRLRAPQLPAEADVACSTLESAGIIPVIRSRCDSHGSPVLAWALREAVTNVVRHSEASRCEIDITPRKLRVADDGVGVGDSHEGNGLRGLRERVARENARAIIGPAYPDLEGTSPERPGTQIEVILP